MFSGLDKITGRTITFDVAINETVQFGALQVTPRACYSRPPTETPRTDAFVAVDEVTLQGEVRAHLHRLDVRLEPRPACGRASDLRCLALRLQRRAAGGRGSAEPMRPSLRSNSSNSSRSSSRQSTQQPRSSSRHRRSAALPLGRAAELRAPLRRRPARSSGSASKRPSPFSAASSRR